MLQRVPPNTLPNNRNNTDGARLDIAANGFWGGRFERTYFDVCVFNPYAPSNSSSNLSSCYRRHETLKKTSMKFVFAKSNTLLSHPLYYLPLVVWLMRQQYFINVLLHA